MANLNDFLDFPKLMEWIKTTFVETFILMPLRLWGKAPVQLRWSARILLILILIGMIIWLWRNRYSFYGVYP